MMIWKMFSWFQLIFCSLYSTLQYIDKRPWKIIKRGGKGRGEGEGKGKGKEKDITKEHQLGISLTGHQTWPLLSRGAMCNVYLDVPHLSALRYCFACTRSHRCCASFLWAFSLLMKCVSWSLLFPNFLLARCLVTAESAWAGCPLLSCWAGEADKIAVIPLAW